MTRLTRWLLAIAARVGPWIWRREGWREWEGELWVLERRGAPAWVRVRFALDAVRHAAWLRWEEGAGLSGLSYDIRLVLRRLGHTPGFTTVTIAMIALGIGVNTALFSALDAALRGSAPYPEPERLVVLDLTIHDEALLPPDTLPWSWPKYAFVRERLSSVEAIAAYDGRDLNLTYPGDPTRLNVELVSSEYFDVLGVRPAVGRGFAASEEPPADGSVAILGHSLWTTRFGENPGVIGRTVTVEGRTLEVIGVMPQGFQGVTGRGEMWVPMASASALLTPLAANPTLLERARVHWFRSVARVDAGSTSSALDAELASVGAALDRAFPDPEGGTQGVAAVPFLRARVNTVTRLALSSVVAGGLLLLAISCANVAGLLLSRASARRSDMAVRAALGAGRSRLVREQLLEGIILSLGGGTLGIALALAAEGVVAEAARYALETSGSRSLQYLNPEALEVSGAALAAGLVLAILTGLVSGMLPLHLASRPDLARDLRAGPRSVRVRFAPVGEWGRGLLVAIQLALTLVLLAGTGLMGASLARLAAIDVGFANDRVLTLHYERRDQSTTEEMNAFELPLLARLRRLPGVADVAIAPCPPLAGPCEVAGVRQVDSGPPIELPRTRPIVVHAVSDDYFSTLGVPLRAGRGFGPWIDPAGPPVAIVNETAARALFGGSVVGHRIAVTMSLTSEQPAEIIGVVGDVRHGRLEDEPMPAIYFSRRQNAPWYGTLFLRVEGDPYAFVDAVRRETRALDPDLPLFEVSTMGELRAASTARTRVILWLLTAFAGLGLLLTAVGIYGVVSYTVVRRTREMGLRLALGAPAAGLVRSVVGRPASLAATGALLGLAGAMLVTRHMQVLLYGVDAWDGAVMGSATGLLVGIAVLAAWIPARRALRVDPAETLRGE